MHTRFLTTLTAAISLMLMSSALKAEHHISETDIKRLSTVLEAQPDTTKARYKYRNPQATLKFFGIKPGMKVVEVLPGGGWYTKILLPYLGKDGHLVGMDYAQKMWKHFPFASEQFLERKTIWVDTWTRDATALRTDDSAKVSAAKYAEIPAALKGTADAVLFIRALHNFARHDSKGGYVKEAMKETYDLLKPGGLVGIVQHAALEDRPDKWADGDAGYLKKSYVMKIMKDHGFEFVGESDINANPKDQAKEGDIVWRLPPSVRGSDDDPVKRAEVLEIGESNRMTLLFRKTE